MLKINDVVVIYRSYVHEEDIPFSPYRDGDVCIILDVYEGGSESWSGRDVGPSYRVLNERSGETIYLDDDTVWLKPYSELFDKPYKRKSEKELKEARKQAFMEWIEAEKQELYESKLYEDNGMVADYIREIKELELGFEDEMYTEKYFKKKMKNLLYGLSNSTRDMNDIQLEYKNELMEKYNNLIEG